jgi:hypothetical protein
MYNQQELAQLFLESAQSKVTDIDVSDLSDFQAKGFAYGGVAAGILLDAEMLYNEALPQYASSLGVNTQLAARAAATQLAASPALLTLEAINIAAGKTYIIPTGTYITASNKNIYKIIATDSSVSEIVITPSNKILYAVSSVNGINTAQSIDALLTFTPPIISTDGTSNILECKVTAATDGTDQESLSIATVRLVNVYQSPLDNVRAEDYQNRALQYNDGAVTAAVALTNRQIAYTDINYNCGVFLAGGAAISNFILNQGLITGTTAVAFNRSVTTPIVNSTQEKFTNEYLVGSKPKVQSISTQGLTTNSNPANAFFKCVVTLQNGYNLSSNVTLENNVFTVKQLIQREIRRAVCGQNFGGTLSKNILTGEILSSILLISSIQNQLDITLGTSNATGTLGAYLVDRSIFVYIGGAYTQPASIALNLGIPTNINNPLPWIYDISTTASNIYLNIEVVEL